MKKALRIYTSVNHCSQTGSLENQLLPTSYLLKPQSAPDKMSTSSVISCDMVLLRETGRARIWGHVCVTSGSTGDVGSVGVWGDRMCMRAYVEVQMLVCRSQSSHVPHSKHTRHILYCTSSVYMHTHHGSRTDSHCKCAEYPADTFQHVLDTPHGSHAHSIMTSDTQPAPLKIKLDVWKFYNYKLCTTFGVDRITDFVLQRRDRWLLHWNFCWNLFKAVRLLSNIILRPYI